MDGGGSGNWHDMMGKVRKKLGFWRLRQLTFEGKILIIKAVILPVFIVVFSLLSPQIISCIFRPFHVLFPVGV